VLLALRLGADASPARYRISDPPKREWPVGPAGLCAAPPAPAGRTAV